MSETCLIFQTICFLIIYEPIISSFYLMWCDKFLSSINLVVTDHEIGNELKNKQNILVVYYDSQSTQSRGHWTIVK